jgi:hypothetical protein
MSSLTCCIGGELPNNKESVIDMGPSIQIGIVKIPTYAI